MISTMDASGGTGSLRSRIYVIDCRRMCDRLRQVERNEPCPCGSGGKFKKCCSPALDGSTWPETPEALMRSRYSAYVTGNVDHLYRTVHPSNPAVKGVDPQTFRKELLAYCRQVDFTGLAISGRWPEDEQGVARVLFTATYRFQGQEERMTELSEFVRLDGNWVYLAGTQQA